MSTCRICRSACEANKRLLDRNFREKAQDILCLLIDIHSKKLSATTCNHCQTKINKYYAFKHKCREQEDPKKRPTASVGFAVRSGDPQFKRNKREVDSNSDSESLPDLFDEEPVKQKKRYGPPPTIEHVRFTKEQLATRSKKELYAERRTYICEECGKTLEKKNRENHRNIHLGVRPYACNEPECGQTFRCPASLKRHAKRNHANGEFPCEVCGKVLGSSLSLRTHMICHREKQFKCDLCDVLFVTKARLDMHMRVHTQTRNYKCPHCSATFYASTVLTLHMRRHTGEKPYVCHCCSFASAHRILYVKHMQNHHPGEEIYKLADMPKIAAARNNQERRL